MSPAEIEPPVAAQTLAPDSAAAPRASRLRVLSMLIRRELWEHRVLWLMPAAIALVLIAFALFSHLASSDELLHFDSKDGQSHVFALWSLAQWGQTVPQYVAMVFVLNFYLLDCLYGERRDRSILFWKSLPVSDGATVAAKLLVALVLVPLGVYVLTVITNVLILAIWHVRSTLGQSVPLLAWNLTNWLKIEALMLGGVVVSILWYAPFGGYLLVVSAWARRSPIGWATLAPLIAIWLESLVLGTHHLSQFFNYRMWGIWNTIRLESALQHAVVRGRDTTLLSLDHVFDVIELRRAFMDVDLWLGVAVTLALAFAATRIRRHRDDNSA